METPVAGSQKVWELYTSQVVDVSHPDSPFKGLCTSDEKVDAVASTCLGRPFPAKQPCSQAVVQPWLAWNRWSSIGRRRVHALRPGATDQETDSAVSLQDVGRSPSGRCSRAGCGTRKAMFLEKR